MHFTTYFILQVALIFEFKILEQKTFSVTIKNNILITSTSFYFILIFAFRYDSYFHVCIDCVVIFKLVNFLRAGRKWSQLDYSGACISPESLAADKVQL